MRLYIDFKAPGAYLAMQPTRRLLRELNPSVEWCAFKSVQQDVPAQQEHEDKGATHRRVRALARQETHLHYAAVQGLDMVFPDKICATDLALSVLDDLSVGNHDCLEDFIQAAFVAYWVASADLNDTGVVAALLQAVGLDAVQTDRMVGKSPRETETVIAQLQARAADDGVVDAPAYVLQGEVFVGREHLPWVRSLLLATPEL